MGKQSRVCKFPFFSFFLKPTVLRNLKFRELKTIPERFGNFVKLAANNWRLHNNRTLTVPEINEMLNRQHHYGDIKANREKYFGDFARCPEYEFLTDDSN